MENIFEEIDLSSFDPDPPGPVVIAPTDMQGEEELEWAHCEENQTLQLLLVGCRPSPDGCGWRYEIDLERCVDVGECLRWLFHLAEKSFLSDQNLGMLVRYLKRLHDTSRSNVARGLYAIVPGKNKGKHHVARERNRIDRNKRWSILQRDGFKCVACGVSGQEERLEVDHITPVSRGGTSDEDNLRVLCAPCNAGKGART